MAVPDLEVLCDTLKKTVNLHLTNNLHKINVTNDSNHNNFNLSRIVQWNAKSAMPKINELNKHRKDFNILLLAETWLTPDKDFMLGGFETVKKDRSQQRGGEVLILHLKV